MHAATIQRRRAKRITAFSYWVPEGQSFSMVYGLILTAFGKVSKKAAASLPDAANYAFEVVRLRAKRRHRMIRRGAARLKNLQMPPRLRCFLREKLMQHLARDQTGA